MHHNHELSKFINHISLYWPLFYWADSVSALKWVHASSKPASALNSRDSTGTVSNMDPCNGLDTFTPEVIKMGEVFTLEFAIV